MREIKFRVWDKKEKKMLTNGICVGTGINGQYIIDADDRNYENDIPWIYEKDVTNNLSIDDFVVMQYTGLKDKNGKEIYEGDIVKENNILYVVCYIDYEASYYAIPCSIRSIDEECKKFKTPYEAFLNGHHCVEFNNLCCKKVIGNIYENPDLLEG